MAVISHGNHQFKEGQQAGSGMNLLEMIATGAGDDSHPHVWLQLRQRFLNAWNKNGLILQQQGGLSASHSPRKTLMGSRLAARRAGRKQASHPTAQSSPLTVP